LLVPVRSEAIRGIRGLCRSGIPAAFKIDGCSEVP
jgi:hypothetical protein